MTQLIILTVGMIALGSFIYFVKFKNKEKPKDGIKRNNPSDYFIDYVNLKLYWTSIAFIVFGVFILIAIIIIEIIFS